jgi:methyl-accepting chemotaxis protein
MTLGVCLLIGMTLAVAALGAWGQWRSQGTMRSMYEDRTRPLEQLGTVNYLVTRNRVLVTDAVMRGDPEAALKRAQQVLDNVTKADTAWQAYSSTRMTEEESALAQAVAAGRKALFEEGIGPATTALQAGRFDAAKEALARVSQLNPVFTEPMDKLVDLQIRLAEEDFVSSQAMASRLNTAAAALLVVALALGAAIGRSLTLSVTRALGAEPAELAAVASRIAQGSLVDDGKAQPPAGSVMASMQAMRTALVQVVGSVRSGVENVATASAQIAQGNADLSSRTEEQASSLQQTAASMEQLTGTVRASADNARQANQLAQGASTAALRGGEVVSQVVQTMGDIQSASTRIAEITGVIDGIAFQTNILALNAAVEAARAGEQGRGFAVVASEVRTLAQRSADAARQIKSLIADSVSKVEAGGTLVQEAGTTMGEVVRQVQRVSDLIGEITAAAGEQSQGIEQVGQAVTQLDQTTQQNAALVEESAAAAESLKAQAQRLAEAVAVFRLDRSAV